MESAHIVKTLWRWLWLVLLLPIAAGGLAYWFVNQQPPTYTTQVQMTVGPGVDNPTSDVNALRASAQFLQTYTQLAKTRPILQQVIDELNLDRNIGTLSGKITVTPNINTQVMTLQVTDTDRKRSVAIANSVANALVRYSNANNQNVSGQDTAGIQSDITRMRQTANDIESRIKQLEDDLAAATSAPLRPPFTDEEAKIKQLEAALQAPSDPTLQKSIDDRRTRIQELEAALQSTANLQAQQVLLNELSREDARLTADLAALKDQSRFLLDQLTQERSTLISLQNNNSQKINQITGELGVQRNRLSDTQRSLSDLYATLRTTATNQVTIIDSAVTATPNDPNLLLNVLVAAVAGLVLALTVAFGVDYIDDTLRSPADLARATGVAVLQQVPQHGRVADTAHAQLAVFAQARTRFAESIRLLSTQILPPKEVTGPEALLFCSLDRGQDAGEIAANLAYVWAQSGQRVILCDADLHNPVITALFRLQGLPGLGDWLGQNHPPAGYAIGWAPGLSVVPSGTVTAQTFELLASTQSAALIQTLRAQADLVLLVGAPLRAYADAFALAPRADGVVLVVRRDKTRARVVSAAVEQLRAVQANVIGAVFTQKQKDFKLERVSTTGIEKVTGRAQNPPAGVRAWFSRPRHRQPASPAAGFGLDGIPPSSPEMPVKASSRSV